MSGARLTSTDYRRPHRPAPVALANRVGQLLGPLGIRAGLDAVDLLKAAQRRTGLVDFGEPSFRERLDVLLESVEREARLHPLGRFMAQQNLIRILVNRLRIEEARQREPAIGQLPIEDPIFVVGLQRTGTTLLHRLLARDPGLRHLAAWEAIQPAPQPAPGRLARWVGLTANDKDARIRQAELAQRGLAFLAPDFFAIHPVEAAEPEEDCLLFDYGFYSTVPEATWRVPAFSAYLEELDHTPAYREVAWLLRYLQHQRPGGRWVLKTPQHLEHLDALLNVFPAARILWIHRDPEKTVASFCSMMAHAWGVFSDRVDPREVAEHWGNKARRMVARALDTRGRVGEGPFLDIDYTDLVADPIDELRRIYAWLGRDFSARVQGRMETWRAGNPQHKHGRHRYRLEDFGLRPEQIEAWFADYRTRFGVQREQD